jgi:hypothetical protein
MRQIKLHKPNTPITPIINWKNAPAYELTNQLTKTLHNYLNLLLQFVQFQSPYDGAKNH